MEENKDYRWEHPSSASNGDENGEAASPVKENCQDQREALPSEPRCVICGRYGEYICDETDDDICSSECKQILLNRLANSWKPVHLTPSVKLPISDECFYVRDDDTLQQNCLTIHQIESLRKKIDIRVKGESVPPPILSFSSCNLPQKLQENLETSGYEIPTPVQMQAIPVALNGKNMLVSAETGSGKTASFLIPIVSRCTSIRLQHPSDRKRPLAMVLAPTRELCVQVEQQAKMLGKGLPFKTALVVGGDAMACQVYRIQQGVELIVGTPGRLIDLLTKNDFELEEVSTLVLDEVDCMLQKGFHDQVMQIFLALSQPQILMFSATIPQEVEKMANSMAKDVVFISIGKPSRANESVKQVVIWVESKQKKQKLFEILTSKQHFKPPVVVFVGSRLGADLLSEAITTMTGLKAQSIHGEKAMKERRESLQLFLTGEVPVMVATGVLGRGVDLLRVRQVIIFDMPNSMKEYVHQIGRASRLGEEGTAIVFVNEEDKNLFRELVENLRSAGAAVPRELVNSRYLTGYYSVGRGQKKRKHGS
ncbi:DEAD-box ATP-dependent RNA helicase 41 [Magnolia sinica]|uniref:DEAD-box ATP-dependent RNA helicase 41 n=1 Tax=Magnolia sinica TaxID=86752 RepID=UPI002659FFDE|nr:DEAD-box ATP-dependent RNA helicase 41 [Magnolia sinica]XP_058102681.1 DEAD-box ATP-dependent RNA helicase 41 [Magnolia sinica]